MRAILLSLVLGVGVLFQQLPDESHIPDAEKRIPPGHYCKRPDVTITKNEKRAHHCACTFSCRVDEQGNVVEAESTDCLAYCHINGRRCTCHVEEPCSEGPIAENDAVLVPPRLANLQVVAVKNLPGHTAERNERINGRRYRLQLVNARWQAVGGTGEQAGK